MLAEATRRAEEHDVSLALSELSEVRDDDSNVKADTSLGMEVCIEEQKDEEIQSFISVLKTALVLWPEDDPPHRCPPWVRCQNLKCRVEAEIENQEYAAAGECDDCGENVNDCECGSS